MLDETKLRKSQIFGMETIGLPKKGEILFG